MSRLKSAFLRSIPVFLITLLTLGMANFGFVRMIEDETEKCWDWLSVATRTMAEKIEFRFEASLSFLEHLGDAVSLKVDLDQQFHVLEYLTNIQQSEDTIFDRIDILLPDNTLILQTGETFLRDDEVTFDMMAAKGRHISNRFVDRTTGKTVIYCATPICEGDEVLAMLIGMVECEKLPEIFPSYSYDGEAKVFLMDRADGNYLMDSWHPELGNMYEQGPRQLLEGYEHVDFQQDIIQGREGAAAFVSRTNGNVNYMYYMPVEGFNWTVSMMIQDEKAFGDVNRLQDSLFTMGAIIAALLAFYLIWNLFISIRLAGHEDQMRRMEVERLANETKSSFLSTMSHDIRTPLNGIVGMLDVIERYGDDPVRLKDCLRKIRVSTQYLMTLTTDMLDLTEIESGKLQLHNDPFDLRILAEDLDVLVQSKAEEAGITCVVTLENIPHPQVLGSEVHLRRILVNLITNAIKYNTERGKVWVTVKENLCEDGWGEYEFTVKDTGIGMSKEFQKTMFNSFEQEQSDARTKYRGHGLGLTIVSKLVEKMGGTIRVDSEKGKGSTFTVTLPMQVDQEKTGAEHISPANAATDLTGTCILLVEDNELNMEIAQILLEDAGAQVIPAVNGREAVRKYTASDIGSIDVILMDVMMPEMDGLEATRTIRAMNRPDAEVVPIIAMTASTFAEDVQRCKDAGMNEHVGKPLNMAEMITKIMRYRTRNEI